MNVRHSLLEEPRLTPARNSFEGKKSVLLPTATAVLHPSCVGHRNKMPLLFHLPPDKCAALIRYAYVADWGLFPGSRSHLLLEGLLLREALLDCSHIMVGTSLR